MMHAYIFKELITKLMCKRCEEGGGVQWSIFKKLINENDIKQ